MANSMQLTSSIKEDLIADEIITEARKRKEKEWEDIKEKIKTSKNEDKEPEINKERKSLYEKLQEQKRLNEEEFEADSRFSGAIHLMADDEIEYLNEYYKTKAVHESKIKEDENRALLEYRKRVKETLEKERLKNLSLETKKPLDSKNSKSDPHIYKPPQNTPPTTAISKQKQLLSSIVKPKQK